MGKKSAEGEIIELHSELLLEFENFDLALGHLLENSGSQAAAVFLSSSYEQGWDHLQIATSRAYPDTTQAKAAGWLEGFLCYTQIYDAWVNYGRPFDPNGPNELSLNNNTYAFIQSQNDWIASQASALGGNDSYWGLVDVMWSQLNGIFEGYSSRNYRTLSFMQFYMVPYMADLEDVGPGFANQLKTQKDCSMYVRLFQSDLAWGHVTHNTYHQAFRVFKTYKFHLSNELVVSPNITMSGRAGDLASKDDFFMGTHNVTAMSTSLLNYNLSNYAYYENPNTLPCWVRSQVAIRVATDAVSWANTFVKYNSGVSHALYSWILTSMAVSQQPMVRH